MLPSIGWSCRRHTHAGQANWARCFSKWLGVMAIGVAALVAAAPDAHATCRGRNFVDRLSLFVNGTVHATSSNGETYDNIRAGSFEADYNVTLCGDGALSAVIVHLGQCTGHRRGCDAMPILYQESPSARSLSKKTPTFTFAPPLDSGAGQSILQTCNAHAEEQKGAARDKEIFPGFYSVTLGVATRRDPGALGGGRLLGLGVLGIADHRPLHEYSKTATGQLTLKILCAPLPMIQEVKAPPTITEAALGVATSGETCPKPATGEVIIAAEAPRPVFYKIERGSGATTTSDWIEGRIRMQKGLMGSESAFLRAEHDLGGLDPGERKFRLWVDGWGKTPWRTLEVECPPFKVTSAWLKYEVEDNLTCPKNLAETATFKATRPGKAPFEIKTQGGLVVHSGTATFEREGTGYVAKVVRPKLSMNAFDSEMMALIETQPDANSGWVRLRVECLEVLSGTLDLRKFTATRCEGEAALSIRTSMPGNVPYQLDCTGGRSWSGTAQSQQTGPDTFVGVDTKPFGVTNNEHVNCALKTRSPVPVKVLALQGHKYECHKPTDVSGSDDLAPETRPEDPPPVGRKLTGDFSFIDSGGTRCPRQGKALINFQTDRPDNVHYSLDCTNGHFSGVAQAKKGPKGGYVAPALVSFDIEKTTQVNCALKRIAPGKPEVHTLKGHLFQCVTPTGVPGSSDLAPDPGRSEPLGPRGSGPLVVHPPRTPGDADGPGKVADPVPRISCAGVVRNGQCFCPRTHKAVEAGNNAWRCIRSVVVDPPRTNNGGRAGTSAADSRPGKTRQGARAVRRRLDALRKAQQVKHKRGLANKAAR